MKRFRRPYSAPIYIYIRFELLLLTATLLNGMPHRAPAHCTPKYV